jgi:hypothetical protein
MICLLIGLLTQMASLKMSVVHVVIEPGKYGLPYPTPAEGLEF